MPECGCNAGGLCECYEEDGVLYRHDGTPADTYANRWRLAKKELESRGEKIKSLHRDFEAFAAKLEKDGKKLKQDAKYAHSKWQEERDYSVGYELEVIAHQIRHILKGK